jgi:hypothetical protein
MHTNAFSSYNLSNRFLNTSTYENSTNSTNTNNSIFETTYIIIIVTIFSAFIITFIASYVIWSILQCYYKCDEESPFVNPVFALDHIHIISVNEQQEGEV